MSTESEWECVTDENQECTERLRIPGGWLYRTILFDMNLRPVSVALVIQPERVA